MLICFGGVCVPYTAVVPLVLLALKWVAVKLAQLGLLPKAVASYLQVSSVPQENVSIVAKGPSVVKTLESEEEFRDSVADGTQKVVCKFTARYETQNALGLFRLGL